jgi:hypothetical protein
MDETPRARSGPVIPDLDHVTDDNIKPSGASVECHMRTSTAPNATPHSTPPSSRGNRGGADPQVGAEHYIWTALVPRLIHPTKLVIVEVLIEAGEPLSIEDLVPRLPASGDPELVERHVRSMLDAGVLEVRSVQSKDAAEPPLFHFPTQGSGTAASSGAAVAHRHRKEN